MSPSATYLDFNAGAPVKPAVADAVANALAIGGNPSSVHRFGRMARAAVDRARDQVAAMVAAAPEQVVFTSGGTEANALALAAAHAHRSGSVVVSAIEHPSVREGAAGLTESVILSPVNAQGVVDLAALEQELASGDCAVVSLMLANNETGVIQPVAQAAALAHRFGALIHCDAAQAPGRISVDFQLLDVDFLTLAAHKIGGPQGVGALVTRNGIDVPAMLRGGGQEQGQRAGTENVPGIVGFGVAAELAGDDLARAPELAALRDELERRLQDLVREFSDEVRVFGAEAARLPNTSLFGAAGMSNETQVIALDLAGIAVSAGAACSSGKVTASHVLRAMGVDDDLASSAIRVSLGWNSTQHHVDQFIGAWSDMYRRHRRSAAEVDATEMQNEMRRAV